MRKIDFSPSRDRSPGFSFDDAASSFSRSSQEQPDASYRLRIPQDSFRALEYQQPNSRVEALVKQGELRALWLREGSVDRGIMSLLIAKY